MAEESATTENAAAAAQRNGDGPEPNLEWHRVLAEDELPEGRVTTVTAGLKSVALVHFDGKWGALDNHAHTRVARSARARSRPGPALPLARV